MIPIQSKGGLKMFKGSEKGRLYVCTVDVELRGTNKDYSAFIIFDVTKDDSKKVHMKW